MNKDNQELRNDRDDNGCIDYVNQKPQHSRKAFLLLGVVLVCLTAAVVVGLSCWFRMAADIYDRIAAQEAAITAQETAITAQETAIAANWLYVASEMERLESNLLDTRGEHDASEAYNTSDVYYYAPEEVKPVYTEQPIEFELYEVSGSEEILVEPSSEGDYRDGYYLLESHKVYAICWDASPLFFNDDGAVRANITVNSDYLIKERGTGTISITLRDCNADIDYVGELKITPVDDNLGIEFCADEARCMPGVCPKIDDNNRFVSYFYTSGEYTEYESSGIHDYDVTYNYEYSMNGSEYEEVHVTGRRPRPTPPPTSDQCDAGKEPARNGNNGQVSDGSNRDDIEEHADVFQLMPDTSAVKDDPADRTVDTTKRDEAARINEQSGPQP